MPSSMLSNDNRSPDPFQHLSNEIITTIFLHLYSPGRRFHEHEFKAPFNFSLVNKRFNAIARHPVNITRYLMYNLGKRDALSGCLRTFTATPEVLRLLVANDTLSVDLFWRLRTQGRERSVQCIHLGRSNDHTVRVFMSVLNFDKLLLPLAEPLFTANGADCPEHHTNGALALRPFRQELYLDTTYTRLYDLLQRKHDITSDFIGRIMRRSRPLTAPKGVDVESLLPLLTQRFNNLLQCRVWVPFDDLVGAAGTKSAMLQTAMMASLEPEMREELLKIGWELDERARDLIFANYLLDDASGMYRSFPQDFPVLGTAAPIVETLRKLWETSSGTIQLSASILGALMLGDLGEGKIWTNSTKHVFDLQKEILDGLEPIMPLNILAHTAADVIRLLHNTRLSNDLKPVIEYLFLNFVNREPALRKDALLFSMYLWAVGTGWGQLEPSIEKIIPFDISIRSDIHPYFFRDSLVEVLCNQFTSNLNILDIMSASIPSLDLYDIALRAILVMVRLPNKGDMLLILCRRYPFVIPHLATFILSHRISSTIEPPSPRDPQLHYTDPIFLSPLAFDYTNARSLYFNLGPHPFEGREEKWYEGGKRDIAAHELCQGRADVAESVWPIDPPRYHGFDLQDQRCDLGKVTDYYTSKPTSGKELFDVIQYGRPDEEVPWYFERTPHHSTLPVAIALLDIFPADSPVLDVMLSHAILNLNSTIGEFYLQNGVPLQPHHIDLNVRFSLPRLQSVNAKVLERVVERVYACDTGDAAEKKIGHRGRRRRKSLKSVQHESLSQV